MTLSPWRLLVLKPISAPTKIAMYFHSSLFGVPTVGGHPHQWGVSICVEWDVKKNKEKCFKNEQNYVKIRKTYFRQKNNRNIRHSLVWARAARKKAKNPKMAKIRKPDFSRAPPTPSVGDGQAIASLRNVMHWAPLRGGPSGEGGLRPHVRFFPLFPPFTLVNPF